MTEEEFKEFAAKIVGEFDIRPALNIAFRWKDHSFATDGRIALVADTGFESLPVAVDDQVSAASSLIDKLFPDIQRKLFAAKYVHFDLDADLLASAAAATASNLEPEMVELRHHVADSDDPDDVDGEDSERFVLLRHSQVIMPNGRRSVVAGYYAGVVADIAMRCGPVVACADRKDYKNTLRFKGKDWTIALMPLFLRDRYMLSDSFAIADARTGRLVSRYGERCNIFELRYPRNLYTHSAGAVGNTSTARAKGSTFTGNLKD